MQEEIIEPVPQSEYESIWAELNKGVVMSDSPLSFEEVEQLI